MARPANGLRGFDPSESDAVRGKGSSRVGKEEGGREGGEATRSPMGGRADSGQERQMLRG